MKLKNLITSTLLICACIFSFTACQNKQDAYSYDCKIFIENEPASDVAVFINGVDTGVKSSISGNVTLTGLSDGDVITFEKEGYVCLSSIKVPEGLHEKTIIMFDKNVVELAPVNPIPSVPTKTEVIEKDNGSFCIEFDLPTGYVFDGFYIDNSLVSTDENYLFTRSMRGDVTIKFSKIYSFRIMSFDGVTTLYDKDVISGEEIKLADCIEIDGVFVGWYEGGRLLSGDVDYVYKVKGDSTLFIKTEMPTIEVKVNGREVVIESNVEYEVLIDGVKVENIESVIKVTDYTKQSGMHVISVINEKFELSKSVNVLVENSNRASNANVILANGKYYLVSDDNLANCKLLINGVKYLLSEQNEVYYADISEEIVDGENEIDVISVDDDGVESIATTIRYVKYYTPNAPKITIENGLLKIEESNYDAKLYVDKVFVSAVENNQVDVSSYDGELSVEFSGAYVNTFYVTIDRNGVRNSNVENLKMIEVDDELYLTWSLPSDVLGVALTINGATYMLNEYTDNINATAYLLRNENNKIVLTIETTSGTIVEELDYYYEKIDTIRFNYQKGVFQINSLADYFEVKINGILLNTRFNTQNIDINYYILSSCRLNVELYGYIDGVLSLTATTMVDYEKLAISKEFIREITLKGNRYLAIEYLNDGEYFLVENGKYVRVTDTLVLVENASYDLIVRRDNEEFLIYSN